MLLSSASNLVEIFNEDTEYILPGLLSIEACVVIFSLIVLL